MERKEFFRTSSIQSGGSITFRLNNVEGRDHLSWWDVQAKRFVRLEEKVDVGNGQIVKFHRFVKLSDELKKRFNRSQKYNYDCVIVQDQFGKTVEVPYMLPLGKVASDQLNSMTKFIATQNGDATKTWFKLGRKGSGLKTEWKVEVTDTPTLSQPETPTVIVEETVSDTPAIKINIPKPGMSLSETEQKIVTELKKDEHSYMTNDVRVGVFVDNGVSKERASSVVKEMFA